MLLRIMRMNSHHCAGEYSKNAHTLDPVSLVPLKNV
jgi:hypothetical protein